MQTANDFRYLIFSMVLLLVFDIDKKHSNLSILLLVNFAFKIKKKKERIFLSAL